MTLCYWEGKPWDWRIVLAAVTRGALVKLRSALALWLWSFLVSDRGLLWLFYVYIYILHVRNNMCASNMASSLLRSTSDFLASGVDKCLSQLYDCADRHSPDSMCTSPSDSTHFSHITRAAFERRYLLNGTE